MKKLLIILLMILVLAVGVQAHCANESQKNFTLTYANGGSFVLNYTGWKNFTYNYSQNNISICNASVTSKINITTNARNRLVQNPIKCQVPMNGLVVTGKTCNGTFYINDSNSGALATQGVLRVNTNTNFSCNGTILVGDGLDSHTSYGIFFTGNNVGISKCKLYNYTYGIAYDSFTVYKRLNIYNNIIIGTKNGIIVRSYSNGTIFNNTIISNRTTGTTYGIQAKTGSRVLNFSIFNNHVVGFKYGIAIGESSTTYFGAKSLINNNYIYNQTINSGAGIQIFDRSGNASRIINNFIYNSAENAIQIYSRNITVIGNYIENYHHVGIDLHQRNASNNNIYNNYITIKSDDIKYRNGEGTSAIVISTSNNTVRNNTIFNITGSGIQIYANNSIGNVILNNTINFTSTVSGSSGYCLEEHGLNNRWINNKVKNCDVADIFINPFKNIIITSVFYNNSNPSNNLYIIISNSTSNFTGRNNMIIYFPRVTTTFNFSFIGNKTFNVRNNSISIWNRTRFVQYNLSAGQRWKLLDDPTVYKLPTKRTLYYSTNITNGIFWINASSGGGALTLDTANKYLNCRGAIINGFGTDAGLVLGFTKNSNINVTNCNFKNFKYGVWISSKNNTKLINSSFINNKEQGIRLTRSNNTYIYNNRIINSSSFGINLEINSNRNRILRNYINNATQRLIYLWKFSNSNLIENNSLFGEGRINLQNSSYNKINKNVLNLTSPLKLNSIEIEQRSNYTNITNNIVYQSGWNCYDITSFYNYINNNSCYYPFHHGLDLCDVRKTPQEGNSIIQNMQIYLNRSAVNGIYVCNGKNNLIQNILISGQSTRGIAVEGNYTALKNNTFRNIQILNAVNFSILSGSNSSTFTNITLTNNNMISVGAFFGNHSNYDRSIFINITSNSGLINFTHTTWDNVSYKIRLLNNILINNNLRTYYYLGSNYKYVNVTNKNFTTYSLPTFNSYCNSTVAPCLNNTAGTKNETIPANGRVVIVGYSNNNQPRIDNLALTAILTYWSWSPNVLTVYSTGTGNSYITNMTKVSSLYYVTKNGVTIETNTVNDYLFTSANWQWADYGTLPLSVASPVSRVIMDVLVILIGLVMLAFVAQPLKDYQSMTTGEWLKFFIFALIVVVMMVILVQQISII